MLSEAYSESWPGYQDIYTNVRPVIEDGDPIIKYIRKLTGETLAEFYKKQLEEQENIITDAAQLFKKEDPDYFYEWYGDENPLVYYSDNLYSEPRDFWDFTEEEMQIPKEIIEIPLPQEDIIIEENQPIKVSEKDIPVVKQEVAEQVTADKPITSERPVTATFLGQMIQKENIGAGRRVQLTGDFADPITKKNWNTKRTQIVESLKFEGQNIVEYMNILKHQNPQITTKEIKEATMDHMLQNNDLLQSVELLTKIMENRKTPTPFNSMEQANRFTNRNNDIFDAMIVFIKNVK